MGSASPIAIAILIVSAVSFFGAFIVYFGEKRKFAGHKDYIQDAQILKKKLNGDLFRDGEDLVVSGNLNRMPTVIRFSYTESTPGVHIRMASPASFGISIVPRGARSMEGRAPVRTSDERFDARFVTRSDDPGQARMFFSSRAVLQEAQKLCCSAATFVNFSKGAIEVSELSVPTPDTAQHILSHLESISRLSTQLERMPGAELVTIQPIRRERHLVLRFAIVIGVVVALIGIGTASRTLGGNEESPAPEAVAGDAQASGILPLDAAVIPGLNDWRIATESDFEPEAAAWMKVSGTKPTGRLELEFADASANEAKSRDTVYLLVDGKGQRRVVMLANGVNRYDVKLPYAVLLAKVSKAAVPRIEWAGRAPESPDGDAFMIVRKPQDHAAGLVVYLSQGRLVAGVPLDYQAVRITQ